MREGATLLAEFGAAHFALIETALAAGAGADELAEIMIADAAASLVTYGAGHAKAISVLRVYADHLEAKTKGAN